MADRITYDEFGRRFVETVVTADRVEQTLSRVVSGDIDSSVKMAGGLVKATGRGRVAEIEVDRVAGEALAYRARVAVELTLDVKISGITYRYQGGGTVALTLHTVVHDDLSIFIEVPDVTPADVDLELHPIGRVASILDQLGGVNEQAKREVVTFVNARKEDPEAMRQRAIEVAPLIESEWERRTADDATR